MPMLLSLLTLRCGPVGLATLAIKWLWGQKMGNSCHIIHCLRNNFAFYMMKEACEKRMTNILD